MRTTPFFWFCAQCGIREKADNKPHAISKSRAHNNTKHAGLQIASWE